MTEECEAIHPLVGQAIIDFTPRGKSAAGATSIAMKSGGVIPVAFAAPTHLKPLAHIERWIRRDLRKAQETAVSTGIPTIFLATRLATWAARYDNETRYAPLVLQPVAYDDDARAFTVAGEAGPNREFENLLDRDATIVSTDEHFQAVVMVPAGARAALRLVDPAHNLRLLDAPAVRLLLGLPADPLDPIPDRAEALKAERRTPLDEDQKQAYAAALSGAHTIVFGPPGTGKSEVLAEIARVGLEAGRRVLISPYSTSKTSPETSTAFAKKSNVSRVPLPPHDVAHS